MHTRYGVWHEGPTVRISLSCILFRYNLLNGRSDRYKSA